MTTDKNAKPTTQAEPAGETLFGTGGQVREVRAGSMSMTVGISATDKLGDDTFEECDYPEIPDGASSEYDTWLG